MKRIEAGFGMLVLVTVPGCMRVQVDVPSLCIRQTVSTEVDGAAQAEEVEAASEWLAPDVEVEVVQHIVADLDAGLESLGVSLDGVDGDSPGSGLWLQDGRMWSDGHDSVAFVRGVSVAVLDAEQTAVPVLSYDRERDGAVSDELIVHPVSSGTDGHADGNVLERLVEGRLSLAVALDVDPEAVPPETMLDTELCMAGLLTWERRWVRVEDR